MKLYKDSIAETVIVGNRPGECCAVPGAFTAQGSGERKMEAGMAGYEEQRNEAATHHDKKRGALADPSFPIVAVQVYLNSPITWFVMLVQVSSGFSPAGTW